MTKQNQSAQTLGLVLKGFPRISETFISNEIRLLEELGFDIHIYSMREPREQFTHASVRAIQARVTYLPSSLLKGLPRLLRRNAALAIRSPRRYSRGLRLLLRRFADAPKKHTWLKHFLQAGYLVHVGATSGHGIGHYHSHFAHTPTSVAMYAAELAGVPFSFFAHAKDIYTQPPKRITEKLEHAAFAVTCTVYNKQHLQALAPAGKQVECVYHGIDLSLFSMNGKPPATKPPYSIMTVARFVPKKGLDTVLKALAILKGRGIDFAYTLIGDGTEADSIKALIHELNLESFVTLVGTIPHEQVLSIYRESDLFVLGCREAQDGDRDGIPNVIAESMAMGVPVAATTVSGIPELVQDGATGLLAPPDNPEALANNIERLLTDTAFRTTSIPSARKRVENVFDNRRLIKRLARVYESGGIPRPRQS